MTICNMYDWTSCCFFFLRLFECTRWWWCAVYIKCSATNISYIFFERHERNECIITQTHKYIFHRMHRSKMKNFSFAMHNAFYYFSDATKLCCVRCFLILFSVFFSDERKTKIYLHFFFVISFQNERRHNYFIFPNNISSSLTKCCK